MCYVCKLCSTVVEPRQPMRKIILYKPKSKAIEREIPVCELCDPVAIEKRKREELAIVLQHAVKTHENGSRKEKGKIDKRKFDKYKKSPAAEKPQPVCDVCGEPIGDTGQQTPEATLCAKHLKMRKRKPSK